MIKRTQDKSSFDSVGRYVSLTEWLDKFLPDVFAVTAAPMFRKDNSVQRRETNLDFNMDCAHLFFTNMQPQPSPSPPTAIARSVNVDSNEVICSCVGTIGRFTTACHI